MKVEREIKLEREKRIHFSPPSKSYKILSSFIGIKRRPIVRQKSIPLLTFSNQSQQPLVLIAHLPYTCLKLFVKIGINQSVVCGNCGLRKRFVITAYFYDIRNII